MIIEYAEKEEDYKQINGFSWQYIILRFI